MSKLIVVSSMTSKIVLVTGASHGIGHSITKFLLSRGDVVIPTDLDSIGLKSFENQENSFPIPMDVTNVESIQTAVEKVKQKYGKIDGIVNNAGIFIGGPIVEVELSEYENIFSINVLGYVRVTKAFFPVLRKGSRIVNVSSEVGRIAFPFNGPYTMTKYAVEAFSDSLRRELTYFDMKVSIIQPGSMQTQLGASTTDSYRHYCKDSAFEKQINRVWKVLKKEGYADPIAVAKKTYNALHCKNPKNRYRVKNNRARRVLEFLPARWVDFIIKNVM